MDMEEVVVSEEPVIDSDDDMSVPDNVEEVFEDDYGEGMADMELDGKVGGLAVVDMSQFTFTGHSDNVYCAAIHPSRPGVVLTGGGDDRAFLWTYALEPSGEGSFLKSSFELGGHTDTVTCVGFNFDGSLALTGGYDGTIKIWDVSTGEMKQQLEGPSDIEWAQWHHKGNAVLGGSGDGTVWMWLAHDGSCVQVFAGHEGGVQSGCFTRDGKTIVTGGEDGHVKVWAPKTGVCKHTFEATKGGHEAMVTCMDSNADGSLVVTGKCIYFLHFFASYSLSPFFLLIHPFYDCMHLCMVCTYLCLHASKAHEDPLQSTHVRLLTPDVTQPI